MLHMLISEKCGLNIIKTLSPKVGFVFSVYCTTSECFIISLQPISIAQELSGTRTTELILVEQFSVFRIENNEKLDVSERHECPRREY